ncbi:MAG: hypothetical protein AAFV71_19585 [Cyanobacteria bacterium J06633_8]
MNSDNSFNLTVSNYKFENIEDLELLVTNNVLEINDPLSPNENEKYQISNITRIEKLEIETKNILSKAGIIFYGFLSLVLLFSVTWFFSLVTSFLVYQAIRYKKERIYILHFTTNAATTFIIKSKNKYEIEELHLKITEAMNNEKIKIEYQVRVNKSNIFRGTVNQTINGGIGIGDNFGSYFNT